MSMIVVITARKGFPIPAALKPTPSLFVPCYAQRHSPAAISHNFLFVKTSADYTIAKLLDSMHVNFSQSEHSVGTRFNFYV